MVLSREQRAEVKQQVAQESLRLLTGFRSRTQQFKSEFRKQTLTAIIAAFGLVIALSWQEFIKKLFTSIPKSGILLYHPYLTDLYTAILVTVLSVAAIMILSKWSTANQ